MIRKGVASGKKNYKSQERRLGKAVILRLFGIHLISVFSSVK